MQTKNLIPVALLLVAGTVGAQDFPGQHKLIRIITTGAGGASDFAARLVAAGLGESLGRNVIVDNRQAGVQPGQAVMQAAPDGSTLLVNSNVFWVRPLIASDVPYDPIKSFIPISTTNRNYVVLVVHPSVNANSVKELIALAKAKPGALNYSTGSTGSAGHLSYELFKSMTGAELTRIPYKSGATEIADLISGQVQLTFGLATLVLPQVKAGKLRAIGISSARPSSVAPGVPAIAATVPGYEADTTTGMWAPAGTPAPVVDAISREVAKVVAQPAVRDRFLTAGSEAVSSTPREFADYIVKDLAKWARIARDNKIRDE